MYVISTLVLSVLISRFTSVIGEGPCLPDTERFSATAGKYLNNPPVKIFKYFWLGTQVSSEIYRIIVEEKLGQKVEYITPDFDYEVNFKNLEDGEVHIDIELWAQFKERQKYIVERGTVTDMGPTGLMGIRGWYIPKYMLNTNPRYDYWREYLKPSTISIFSGTNTSNTFPESPQLLKTKLEGITLSSTIASAVSIRDDVIGTLDRMIADSIPSVPPQTPAKLYSPYPSWGVPDPQIVENLGLNIEVVGLTELNMEEKLMELLKNSTSAGKPHLTYFWDPHSIHSSLSNVQVIKINLPQWSQDCESSAINATHGGVNCDYGTSPLLKIASRKLRSVSLGAFYCTKAIFSNQFCSK